MKRFTIVLCVAAVVGLASTAAQASFQIGDVGPAGGWIFYDFGDGLHYLEAAPSDLPGSYYGKEKWSNITNVLIGTTSTGIGTGQANTTAIIGQTGFTTGMAGLADALVVNGYDDWYLPSLGELTAMRDNLADTQVNVLKYGFWGGVPGTSPRHYWSSSEWNATKGQDLQFSYEGTLPAGSSGAISKGSYTSTYGRAVRDVVIPEPATIIVWSLLGLAAAGYGVWRRKRKAA